MSEALKSTKKEWMNIPQILILVMGGSMIYMLPYLKNNWYDVLLNSFGINNLQLGLVGTVYAAAATIGYFFGGYLADRFPAKWMLVFSFISTGIGGLYYMTVPSYTGVLLLHLFWGISTVLTFWPAFYKTVRMSASEGNQGKANGFVDGGRKILAGLIAIVGVAIFNKVGGDLLGFKGVVLFYSILLIVIGLLVIVFWRKEKKFDEEHPIKEDDKLKVKDFISLLRAPIVWVFVGLCLTGYGMYRFTDFITPYTTQAIGLSVSLAAIIAAVRSYWMPGFGAGAAGVLSDKIKASNALIVYFIIGIICMLGFVLLPATWMVVITIVILICMAVAFPLKSLVYAMLPEGKIPVALTGSVLGIGSTIGFAIEVPLPTIGGAIIDAFPGLTGFQIIFGLGAALGVLGILLTKVFTKMIKNPEKAWGKYYSTYLEKAELDKD